MSPSEEKVVLAIQESKKKTDYQLVKNLVKHIFRAYDIRGIVGDELTADVFYTIGRGLGALLKDKQIGSCVLGFDGRLSSEAFADALTLGLLHSGIDVVSVGMVPSPVLYFALEQLTLCSGVMITGSHNPKEYNGIKIVVDGKNLNAPEIEALYLRIKAGDYVSGEGVYSQTSVIDAYIEAIANQCQLHRTLRIAIDCGNGVAGLLAGRLFRAIGAEVIELFCDVDGNFPNHHPDPSVKENVQALISLVQSEACDLGLAFDGDADRLGIVTPNGELIWPDRQMILLAQDLLKRKPGETIVYDVKCSYLLEQAIKQAGGIPLMCPTGHSIVKKVMRENNVLLAGEMSGHIFIKDAWNGFDDALYAGARILTILANNVSLSPLEQLEQLPNSINTPELKIMVEEAEKFALMSAIIEQWQFEEGQCSYVDGLRWQSDNGWGLIRASNTTPCLVARFEAATEGFLHEIQQLFRNKLLEIDARLEVPF